METSFSSSRRNPENSYPHSLGILIEWKPQDLHGLRKPLTVYPHSLGILIEWKLNQLLVFLDFFKNPHSLGILIEWKREVGYGVSETGLQRSPLAGDPN